MTTRHKNQLRLLASLLAVTLSTACGANPLVGRWTTTAQFPPNGVGGGPQGTVATVIEFGADNSLAETITASPACSGTLTLTGYRISVTQSSATSGSFMGTALGTCSGGPVRCPFGGMMIDVAVCGGGIGMTPTQYVLNANGTQLSLNGTLYTRVN
jgi:hypothetical protein